MRIYPLLLLLDEVIKMKKNKMKTLKLGYWKMKQIWLIKLMFDDDKF